MNIKSILLTSFASDPKLPAQRKPEDFLGHPYPLPDANCSPPFLAYAGGLVTATQPFSFDIRSMDCFLLLYTKEGCGKLTVENQVHTLIHPSLLLLDCRSRFRIDVAIDPWKYQVLFLNGAGLSQHFNLLPPRTIPLMPISVYSETALCLEKLLHQCDNNSPAGALSVSALIDRVVTDCLLYQLRDKAPASPVPAYLEEMRTLFDNEFQKSHSLDELEERFHISKYRLCREFGQVFGTSPVQYLNKRRIEIAKHLLVTTNHRVHEIGSMVGIDNTNHFISLFKKFTRYTPAEYKQRMTI